MKTNKCAITGSNGYLGSNLTQFLAKEQDFDVYEMARKPKAVAPDHFIHYNLQGKNDFSKLEGIDSLIHCAYDFTPTAFSEICRVNADGTLELFKQAKKAGVKKIIFISSMSAFAGARSHYGKAKWILENEALKMGILVIKPGLIFSAHCGGIVGAINRFVTLAPVVPLIGCGQQVFYPCHVEDLCQLILFLLREIDDYPAPIFAATDNPLTFKEIVKIFALANHKKVGLLPIPYSLLYTGMKLLEIMHISIGLRADSLRGAQYYNRVPPDFKFIHDYHLQFRPLNEYTILSDRGSFLSPGEG